MLLDSPRLTHCLGFKNNMYLSASPGPDFFGFGITMLPASSVQIVPNSREISVLSSKLKQVSHAKLTVSMLNLFNHLLQFRGDKKGDKVIKKEPISSTWRNHFKKDDG